MTLNFPTHVSNTLSFFKLNFTYSFFQLESILQYFKKDKITAE